MSWCMWGNILSTMGMFSAVGDILSTVRVFSIVGGYLEYRGGKSFVISAPPRHWTPHGAHISPNVHHDIPHGTQDNLPTVLMISPTVLKISPYMHHDIHHSTEHPPRYHDIPHMHHYIPHGIEHPPRYCNPLRYCTPLRYSTQVIQGAPTHQLLVLYLEFVTG